MAFNHGKAQVFKLDNSSAVLQDISAKLSAVDFPEKISTHDVTAIGAASKSFLVGLKEGNINLQGFWDSTIDAQLVGVKGQATALNFQYGPNGSATGQPRYKGTCFLTDYKKGATVADAVKITIALLVTGDVLQDTWP